MTCCPISYRPGENGSDLENTTVVSSAAATFSTYGKLPSTIFCCSANVVATSWAVNGSPSDHVTPSRRWNVTVLPSSDDSHDSASHGVVLPSAGLYTS